MHAFSLMHRHTGEQYLLYTCVIIEIETALYFCLFQMITILQSVLIHKQLIYDSNFLHFSTMTCNNFETAKSISKCFTTKINKPVTVFVRMNCLTIPLNGMPYQSEGTLQDYPDGPKVRTSPSNA